LKTRGTSNRAIGRKLGIDEKAIRKRLRRLGWKSPARQLDLFESVQPATLADEQAIEQKNSASDGPHPLHGKAIEKASACKEEQFAYEPDPGDRWLDRILAAMGLLDDAKPIFSRAIVPRAGVLLAIPVLQASGLVSIANDVYGSIGPAFYGLRTTMIAFVLFALLRIKRPEGLKEHAPADLGHIIGLDRVPEVKTLRGKLTRLAGFRRAEQFGRKLAQRRVAEHGQAMGFLYVDGHVRVYHGKHEIPKTHVIQMRRAFPATTDYWVNDAQGDPLFVVTAEANAAITKMLPIVLKEVRTLLGAGRRATIVFDRGGWSPKLFVGLIAEGFDILTYRKGPVRKISPKRFVLRKATLDARPIEYCLNDQPVRFLKKKLRLRQITRLSDNGHQTPILTSRWDLPDINLAYRMFERWRQENFFKYIRDEYLIDALVDYGMEPDDPNRLVTNPAWHLVNQKLKATRATLARLEEGYGGDLTKVVKAKLEKISATRREIAKLKRQRKAILRRLPVGKVQKAPVVKLTTERKHLTSILKMVAYQAESDLLNILRVHYARSEDEGRTLIQTALQSTATIDSTRDELRVTLAQLSSPHRSKAIAALCEALNETRACFPGTSLRMHYAVAGVAQPIN
jgi:prepilin-type processing-associated H-X9-DG protein